MTIPNPNQHVVDYLRYYTDPERKLDYAVMLDAPWGSGKTHLLKAFLAEANLEHLYVSLYGVSSTVQIDDELFRQMHPLLGSKGMRLAGRLAKGVLKGALKIDLGHGTDGSVSASVPSLDVKEFFSGPKSRLIVFDDLERSGMAISEVLGYINAFVEQEGVKAIIVANVDEAEKVERRFREVREKLVGQTMFVRADVGAALPAFIDLITDEDVRRLLAAERQEILNVHCQSGTNNLRILKQSLWDFERVAKHLTPDEKGKAGAVRALLRQVLSMAIDIKAGRLTMADIGSLGEGATVRIVARFEGGVATPADEFEDRYGASRGDWIIPPEELGAFLAEGHADSDKLRHFFEVSRLFAEPSTIPAWRRAWYGFSSDDTAYEAAIAEVEKEFVERAYVGQHVLYHVLGVRLRAVTVGALTKSKANILDEGKAYIDDLAKKGLLESALRQEIGIGDFGSYDGLGYQEIETAEFKELVQYYAAAAEAATRAAYSEVARRILTKGAADPETAFSALTDGDAEEGTIFRVPVLAAISPSDFVAILVGYSASAQTALFKAFKRRYRYASQRHELHDELVWLRQVQPLLAQAISTLRPMSRWRLASCMEDVIDPLLAKAGAGDNSSADGPGG